MPVCSSPTLVLPDRHLSGSAADSAECPIGRSSVLLLLPTLYHGYWLKEKIFRLILATASGEPSKSEIHGFGQDEFVPWYIGAVV